MPNRHALLDHFNLAAALAARSGEHVALLFIDLDGFKQVNDTFGHSFEDKLLRQVALRLVGCVQASDTTCRYGGDEFAVLCRFGVGIGPRAVSRQGSSRDRRGGMPLFRRREGKVRVRGPAARAGRRTSRPQRRMRPFGTVAHRPYRHLQGNILPSLIKAHVQGGLA